MVAPERDVPGNATAATCASPMAMAMIQVTLAPDFLPRSQRSMSTKSTPPTSSAIATGNIVFGSNSSCPVTFFITPLKMSAPATVMQNATKSFARYPLPFGSRNVASRSLKSGSAAIIAHTWMNELKTSLLKKLSGPM